MFVRIFKLNGVGDNGHNNGNFISPLKSLEYSSEIS